jgi:hypothetical protein
MKQKRDDGIRLPAEYEKARVRIGFKAEQQIKWLLHFADLKLDALSEGDFLNVGYEVRELSRILPGVDQHMRFIHCPRNLDDPDLFRLPTLEELGAHQHFVQQCLEGILQAGMHDFNIPAIRITLFSGANGQPGELWMFSDDAVGPFNLAVALALRPLARRLRRCPQCQKRFLAKRANQDYDSPSCQSRAAMRRYRQTKGLVTGRRRGRPPKQGKTGHVRQKQKGG